MNPARYLLVAATTVLAMTGASACQITFGSGGGGGGSTPGGDTSRVTDQVPRPSSAASVPNGTPVVTFRGTQGSETVDCISTDTEFALSAHSDRMRWTATPSVKSIVVSPAAGELAEDATVVVHVRGSSRGAFKVHVEAPNKAGSGSTDVQFTCR